MKVVYGVYCGESYGGGVGEVAYEIASAFSQKHQVLLVRTGPKTRMKKISPRYSQLIVHSSSDGEIFIPRLNLESLRYLFMVLDRFNPDIIHVHDNGPLNFLLQVWAVKHQVPCFYTLHLLPTKTSEFGAKEFSKKLGRLIDTDIAQNYLLLFLNNCDAVVALNKKAEKDVFKFGYTGRCFIIPNGRYLKLYDKGEPAEIAQKGKRLIFVGHLCKRKNQEYLLRVMKYLPKNYVLDLVGSSLDDGYLGRLREYREKNQLFNVNLIGKIAHSQLPRYLKRSHLFVSASRMEVQSLVVMEALASGTPVVGLANETIDEFVDDSMGARLPKKTSPKKFAEKVEEICSLNQEDYAKLCQRAKERVAGFDWGEVIVKTKEAYSEMIERKKRTGGREKRSTLFSDLSTLATLLDTEVGTNTHKRIMNLERKLISVFDKNYLYVFLMLVVVFLGDSLLRLSKALKEFKETLTS
jgi:glycosyltransferase involved in cell wall biosynthesis